MIYAVTSYILSSLVYVANGDPTMRQVVAYMTSKTMEIIKTSALKSIHGRLQDVVVYERFQL